MQGKVVQIIEDGLVAIRCSTKTLKHGDSVEVVKPKTDNARKYSWHLIGEIAAKTRLDRMEVYEDILRHYAPSILVTVSPEVDFRRYYKHCEIETEYQDCTDWVIYKGISEYTTEEMSRLIHGLEQEAENVGVETLTSQETERLLNEW